MGERGRQSCVPSPWQRRRRATSGNGTSRLATGSGSYFRRGERKQDVGQRGQVRAGLGRSGGWDQGSRPGFGFGAGLNAKLRPRPRPGPGPCPSVSAHCAMCACLSPAALMGMTSTMWRKTRGWMIWRTWRRWVPCRARPAGLLLGLQSIYNGAVLFPGGTGECGDPPLWRATGSEPETYHHPLHDQV